MIVVGLGQAGCNVAKAFSKFPQYQVYTIDTTAEADITIKKQNSHEDYDTHFPDLSKKLQFSNEEVFVVVCGSGQISGACLRLLEQIKNNNITVVYIQPDLDLVGEIPRLQEKIVSNILQEYARSGALSKIIMIDNGCLEKTLGPMSIIGYYDTLNQAIVNTIHMINVFKNSEPVIGSFIEPSEMSRITTVGIVKIDASEEEENWFYDLQNAREVVYYYGINEDDLKNDETLFKKINSFVKSKVGGNINVSYGIFKTTYEQKYCYCIKYSSVVQSYIELLDDQEIS